MKEDEIIKKLKEVFDAESEDFFPDKGQLEFMDKRDEIEKNFSYCFEAYVDNYDLIQEYGLGYLYWIGKQIFYIFSSLIHLD